MGLKEGGGGGTFSREEGELNRGFTVVDKRKNS